MARGNSKKIDTIKLYRKVREMADVKAAADKAFLAMMEAVRKGPAVREKMAMLRYVQVNGMHT